MAMPDLECMLVQVILTQQPALFDRAVKKLFSEEIAEAEQGAARRALAADRQEPTAWVLQSFWDRHSSIGPSLAPKPAVAPAVAQGLSRYETDFQVRRKALPHKSDLDNFITGEPRLPY